MGFDGEAFVAEMRQELIDSGRTLDKATWVERVAQGEATPQEMVGWARQHYWGVTYHTRRFLSIWVGRIPYEMTDSGDREHRRGGARHPVEVRIRSPALALPVHAGAGRAGQRDRGRRRPTSRPC